MGQMAGVPSKLTAINSIPRTHVKTGLAVFAFNPSPVKVETGGSLARQLSLLGKFQDSGRRCLRQQGGSI